MRSYTLSKQYREFSREFAEKKRLQGKTSASVLAKNCRRIKNAAAFAGFLAVSDMAQVLEHGFRSVRKVAKKDERAFRVLLIKAYKLLLKVMVQPPVKVPRVYSRLVARLRKRLPEGWKIPRDAAPLLLEKDTCRIPRRFYETALDRDLHLLLVAFNPETKKYDIEKLTDLADRLAETGALLMHGPLAKEEEHEPEDHYFLFALKEPPETFLARERVPGKVLRTIYSPEEEQRKDGTHATAAPAESYLLESFRTGPEDDLFGLPAAAFSTAPTPAAMNSSAAVAAPAATNFAAPAVKTAPTPAPAAEAVPAATPSAEHSPTSNEELSALMSKDGKERKKTAPKQELAKVHAAAGTGSSARHVRFTIGFKLIFIISTILVLSSPG